MQKRNEVAHMMAFTKSLAILPVDGVKTPYRYIHHRYAFSSFVFFMNSIRHKKMFG